MGVGEHYQKAKLAFPSFYVAEGLRETPKFQFSKRSYEGPVMTLLLVPVQTTHLTAISPDTLTLAEI